MSTPRPSRTVACPPAAGAPATNYLNVSSQRCLLAVTTDHKRIAILYLIPVTLMFFIGGLAIRIDRLNLITPEGGLVERRHLQQVVHGPRRGDGVLLPRAGDPHRAGELLPADDDRRQGPGLSADQPAELVPVHGRAPPGRCFAVLAGGVDTGWTFYTPYSSEASHYNVALTMVGVVIAGFSSLLTG